jgi:16S rRNA (adenine(1408)-N(1))-methyltransferase
VLHIGIDAAVEGLREASRRAARSRERVQNAVFVLASAEKLPPDLESLADRVTAILPWGSLLRAVVEPDVETLRAIRRLCRDGASFTAIVSLDAERDRGELARLGIGASAATIGTSAFERAYRHSGFAFFGVEPMALDELRAIPSTWAKRVTVNPERQAWRISATVGG